MFDVAQSRLAVNRDVILEVACGPIWLMVIYGSWNAVQFEGGIGERRHNARLVEICQDAMHPNRGA